jgi:hypothetical protein
MEDASEGEFAAGEPGVTSWNVVQSKEEKGEGKMELELSVKHVGSDV